MERTQRKGLLSRWTAMAVAVALTFSTSPARPQTFLQDFYNASGGGQLNVTSAGVYQSAGLNTVTGGGFVYKAPRRDFIPYYVTPPSLRMGCGGIDVLLGGFSLPSRAEFVAFLRNIGQNLPGLAFQLALQSLSPDLATQVTDFRKLIMEYSAKGIDSCKAATALLETVTGKEFMETQQLRAKNAMRANGVCTDEADCVERTKADLGTVLANCQTITNSAGNVEESCEMNVVWSLLKSGEFAYVAPDRLAELMMSVLGTRLHRRFGAGADTVIATLDREALIKPEDVIGSVEAASLGPDVKYWSCDEPVYCLNPVKADYTERGLARWVYDIARRYHRSIVDRIPEGAPGGVTRDEMFLLASATSIPIIRIINAVSYSRFQGVADDVIRVYSEAAAYELAMRFFETLLTDVEKIAATKKANAQMKYVLEYARDLSQHVRQAREEVRQKSRLMHERMARIGNFVTMVEHLERSLKTNLAADLAANLRFGAR